MGDGFVRFSSFNTKQRIKSNQKERNISQLCNTFCVFCPLFYIKIVVIVKYKFLYFTIIHGGIAVKKVGLPLSKSKLQSHLSFSVSPWQRDSFHFSHSHKSKLFMVFNKSGQIGRKKLRQPNCVHELSSKDREKHDIICL